MTATVEADRWVLKLPALYPKQRAAFFSPARLAVCEASTKAGKSVGALSWQLDYAVNRRPGAAHVWVSPIYAQAKVMHARLCRWLVGADPTADAGWRANHSDLSVVVPGGSVLWFKGGDNPDSIYGSDYASGVIDEFTRCKEEVWYAVRSTLTATGGPVRLIGNVKGRGNWGYRMARRAEAGEPGMAYSKLTAFDAVAGGVLPASEIDDARRTLPEIVFRELYLAEPADDGGNPFGIAAIRKCSEGVTLADTEPVAIGVDLAKSVDWTVVCGLDAAGRCCLLERWQSDWGQTRRRVLDLIGQTRTLIDSTGVGDPIVEDLQRERGFVEGFKFSGPSKQQLMEGLAAGIQRRELRFPQGWLTAELEAFEYEYTRNGCRYSAPAGQHDDGVCALALAREMWERWAHERIEFHTSGFSIKANF